MTDFKPKARKAHRFVRQSEGPDQALEVELHDVTHHFRGLRKEDTLYLLDNGMVVKVKTVRLDTEPGQSAFICSPSICAPGTGKAIDHPQGPGGKFICKNHYVVVMSDEAANVDQDLLNGHAQAVHYARNAYRHHAEVKAVRVAPHDPKRHPLVHVHAVSRASDRRLIQAGAPPAPAPTS